MLSQTIQDSINTQIANEFYSAYFYLQMSSYFEGRGLPGFGKWMRAQYQEETLHGLKLFDFINDRNGRVVLQGIEQPPSTFKSPLDVFQQALAHEQKVTGLINNLYALAQKENDYATQVLLQWFISEQVEEEKTAEQIVDQLKLAGDSGSALLLLDQQLGARKPGAEAGAEGASTLS